MILGALAPLQAIHQLRRGGAVLTVRLVAGVMLVSACGTPPAPPTITTPIAATLVGSSLVLDGERFGERDPNSMLVYVGGTTLPPPCPVASNLSRNTCAGETDDMLRARSTISPSAPCGITHCNRWV